MATTNAIGVNISTGSGATVTFPAENCTLPGLELNNSWSGENTIINTHYLYFAASATADTVNDIRLYNNAGVATFQVCTVANAAKDGGTWGALGTIPA